MILKSHILDYIESLNVGGCYVGPMPDKPVESIGIYNLRRSGVPYMPVGGISNASYEEKGISLLVHWNESPSEAEQAAINLFNALMNERNATVNNRTVTCIKMLTPEPISVGTDENGIHEYVIECIFYIQK